MKRLTYRATVCGMLLCIASCQHEGPSAEPPESDATVESDAAKQTSPPESVGPVVSERAVAFGDKLPSFELQDQHGQPRTLAGLLGELPDEGHVALVFFRSADW